MKSKLIIIFLFIFSNLFSNVFILDNKNIELDTMQIENYRYINIKDLKLFGLDIIEEDTKIQAEKKGLTLTFYKNSQNIKINNLDIKLTNISISNSNKNYVDFDFILYTMGYTLENNFLFKEKSQDFPINKNSFIVAKEARKIISLSPGATEKLAGIGALDYIKARSEYDNYNEQIKNTVNIGTMFSPKMETIINLNPDIAIAETHYDPSLMKKLQEAGIEVYYSPYPQKVEDIYDFVLDMGLITGKIYEARGVVASMINKIGRSAYIFSNIKSKPKVYYVVGTGNIEYSAGRDTFISDIIKKAGAVNIADDISGWVYSAERLIDNNPDFIFGGSHNINYMKNHDIYKGLKAFKNNNYFIVDENIYNLSGIELINKGLYELIANIHGKEKAEEMNFYGKE